MIRLLFNKRCGDRISVIRHASRSRAHVAPAILSLSVLLTSCAFGVELDEISGPPSPLRTAMAEHMNSWPDEIEREVRRLLDQARSDNPAREQRSFEVAAEHIGMICERSGAV